MSIIILLATIGLLLLLEKQWFKVSGSALDWSFSCDKTLVEPDAELCLTTKISNRTGLPIPFIRLHQEIPSAGTVRQEIVRGQILRNSGSWWHIEERFSLRGRQYAEKTVSFSLPKRGAYKIGRGRITIGDLLGFQEQEFSLEPDMVVVMPERSRNLKNLEAAGGFLGDISVRRFIMEDPIMTVGFRDYSGREPMKSISWTRTAMTGTMQVKQFDYTSEKTAVVILNVRGATGELLEESLRLTRSVCERLEKDKIPYSLRTNGNLPGPVGKLHRVPEGLGESHLNTILYGLGRADSTCFYTFHSLVKQVMRSRKQNDAYIVITPSLDQRDMAAINELRSLTGNPVCVLEVEMP